MALISPSKRMNSCILSRTNWKRTKRKATVTGKEANRGWVKGLVKRRPVQYRLCVLLFPPLPSRLRYLTHRAVEERPELTAFSVGEGWHRRVVVCHCELRAEVEEDHEAMENSDEPKYSVPSRNRASKRPDKPLYVPRAVRKRLSLQNPPAAKEQSCPPSPDSSSCCDTTDATNPSSTCRQGSQPSAVGSILSLTAEMSIQCPLEGDPSVSCFPDVTLDSCEKDSEYGATVPCNTQTEDSTLDATDLSEEIKAHLKEAVVFSIEYVHNDYCTYENVCVNVSDFCHVIEIYNFPPFFKTDDLLDAFTEFSEGGMRIKWVDNTHALGVFSSESAALHALSICHPLLKARMLAEGSKKAKGKAVRRAEFIQPVKERPKTDSAVARRMVTRALGLRGRGRAQRY